MSSLLPQNIVAGAVLTASLDPFFTAPALNRVRICNATLTNSTGGAVACTATVISATGGTRKKISLRSIAVNETYTCPELIGAILEPGDILKALGDGVTFDVSAFTQV